MTETYAAVPNEGAATAGVLAELFHGLGFAALVRDPHSADVVAASPGAEALMTAAEPGAVRMATARIGAEVVRVEVVPSDVDGAAPLTPRQRGVAALLARGLTNQEIADELGISLHTVRRHLEHVFRRLQVLSLIHI